MLTVVYDKLSKVTIKLLLHLVKKKWKYYTFGILTLNES